MFRFQRGDASIFEVEKPDHNKLSESFSDDGVWVRMYRELSLMIKSEEPRSNLKEHPQKMRNAEEQANLDEGGRCKEEW